jgi:hypothetical protein
VVAHTFLISDGVVAWLCSSLEPLERIARFADPNVAHELKRLAPRAGAVWAYMESCEVNCELDNGLVTTVRELTIIRGTAKHSII